MVKSNNLNEIRRINKKEKNVAIEILRIFAMILIIFQHFMEYGGIKDSAVMGDLMYPFVYYMYGLVQIAVNCYILISGYFLVTSKFKFKKLMILWIEVFFYSIILYLAMVVTGYCDFSLTTLVSCFIPIVTGRYWFVTIYFGMYLLSPFLNIAIRAMNKHQHAKLNILLLILFSIWTTIPISRGMNVNGGWSIAWFVVLYFISAYFRLYYVPNYKIKYKLLVTLGLSLILPVSKLSIDMLTNRGLSILAGKSTMLFKYESFFVIMLAISVFVLFLNIKIKQNAISSFILKISPCTFGVYLIHHHAKIYPIMWGLIDGTRFLNNWWFPFYMTGIVLLIFSVCIFIDKIRSIVFVPLDRSTFLERFANLIENTVKKVIHKACIIVKRIYEK